MSRRKIKKKTNKGKQAPVGNSLVEQLEGKTISQKQALIKNLTDERSKKKRDDADIIYTMSKNDKVELERIFDYKYQQELARELGWSVGRLKRAFRVFGAKL